MKAIRLVGVSLSLGLGLLVTGGWVQAATPLPNGFTAKVIAYSGETIGGNVNATGYDVGIYIGPGVHDVTVQDATVTGANDEGILVQDASGIVIKDSIVKDNAVAPYVGLSEVKGIALVGTSHVLVTRNTVLHNDHGGIGLYDDGPNSPFAPTAIDLTAVAGVGNVVTDNVVRDNLNDCGIVVSAKNPGGGLYDNVVADNTVLGFDAAAGDFVPGVGGIIVAGGAFGPVQLVNNMVVDNTVIGGFIPGISLHAFGPGVITGTMVIGNVLSDNGAGAASHQPTGLEIAAIPHVGVIAGTQILHTTVASDYYGVFHTGDSGTHIAELSTVAVTDPIYP